MAGGAGGRGGVGGGQPGGCWRGGTRGAALAARRAVRPDQLRKAVLDRAVAAAQRDVLGVRDFRRVLGVVKLVVVQDLGGEPLPDPRPRQPSASQDQAKATAWPSRCRTDLRSPTARDDEANDDDEDLRREIERLAACQAKLGSAPTGGEVYFSVVFDQTTARQPSKSHKHA